MINISLSSVLLFALTIPLITKYVLWPQDSPYIYTLIYIIFLTLFAFDLKQESGLIKKIRWAKITLFLSAIILTLGSVMMSSIVTRHQRAPIFNVHDIILQAEAGTQFLLQGKNPYTENYLGTPLEEWEYREDTGVRAVNPALYHFVMSPFYLTFHLPFYAISMVYPHYFDARIVLIFLLGATVILATRLQIPQEEKLLFISLLALNPANINYFIEGRSDFFVFSFLFLSWFLLSKRKLSLSAVALALAVGVKQSAWPAVPFFLVYLIFEKRGKILSIIKTLIPGTITIFAIFIPFVFWDFKAFWEDTILYLSGGTAYSYPIAGYGFGMLLYKLGIVKDLHVAYPFFIWQILICLPLMAFLVYWQKRNNTVKRLIFSYGLFLFVFWYFSRFFNNNHLAYLSLVFISAYFWPSGQKQEVERRHFWPADHRADSEQSPKNIVKKK